MGGNVFKDLPIVRLHRTDLNDLLYQIVDGLNCPGFTIDYAKSSLLGSVGKQETSGDVDFAVNSYKSQFVGEKELSVFRMSDIMIASRKTLPMNRIRPSIPNNQLYQFTTTRTQFYTAWMVGGKTDGLVQVDFIYGKHEWLMFSHFSPGKDISPWKGVLLSTALGVLAKVRKDYELINEADEQVARVGLYVDLEKGLHRKWKIRLQTNQGPSEVPPDLFETKHSYAPRFSRLGYVNTPDEVLRILFRTRVTKEEVNTFEKFCVVTRECLSDDDFCTFKEKFIEAFTRSAGKNDYTIEDIDSFLNKF